MKKFSIAKIALLIFVCVMLFGAMAVGVYADETTENTALNDVFQFGEYSMDEDGTVSFGFTLNKDALGENVEIGIIIAPYHILNGKSPIGADGEPIDGIYVNKLNGKNTEFSFKLVNFKGEFVSRKYVIAPYLYDGTTVYYYQNGEVSEEVPTVSYEEILTSLGHVHTEEVVEGKAPTCTETGLTEGKKCSVCDAVIVAQEEIAALGHTEETVAGKDATCTETGLTEGKVCSVCGATTVAQEKIAALGHTEETVAGKDATCTEAGLTEGKICTVCGATTVAQEEIAALGHTEETVAGKDATCTETGLTEGTKCSVCDAVIVAQEEIAALGHDYVDGYCSVCEAVDPDYYFEMTIADALLAADGKNVMVTGTVIEASAWNTKYNDMNVTIKDDNGDTLYVYGLVTEVALHDIITVKGTMATYNEVMREIGIGATAEVVGTHTCVEFTEATCNTPKTCVFCGTKTDEYAEHEYVDGICANCNAVEGMSETNLDYVFADYGKGTQYAENEEHKLDENTYIYTTQAHFTTELRLYSSSEHNGFAIIKSANAISKIAVNAGYKADVLVIYGSNDEGATWIPVAEISVASSYAVHSAELGGLYNWIKLDVKGTQQVRIKSMTLTTVVCEHLVQETTTIDATCTEVGRVTVTCKACGTVISDEEIATVPHSYEQTVTAPTCLDKGYTTYTCACGDTYEGDYVDALGHEFNDDGDCIHEGCDVKKDHACEFTSEVTKAPTCTETGVETFTCTCGESYTEEIAALGHTEETVEAVAPSCEATGLTEGKKCSVCGEITVAQEEIAALGHDYVDGYCSVCQAVNPDHYFNVTISEALAAEEGKKVTVSGTVSKFYAAWNATYGNMSVYIIDAEGNEILCYGMTTPVSKGDIITVTGVIDNYEEVNQLGKGCTAVITGHDESYDVGPVEMTIADAILAPDGTDVIITGTVIELDGAWDSENNRISVTIKDENGDTLYIYRLATQVALHDVITVTGSMGTYNNVRQIAQGATAEIIGTHTCTEFTEATCIDPKACVFCGTATEEYADHNYDENGICTVCGCKEGVVISKNEYVFSKYPVGEQYATETHKLDEFTEMYITKCHLNGELRIYSSSTNPGIAIFKSVNEITAISVNAGNKVDVLVVYGSNDEGATWTEVARINVASTAYTDYEADLGGSYKWIKLDVAGSNQVRLKSITLTTLSCAHSSQETTTTDATCTEAGSIVVTCKLCGKVISQETIATVPHSYEQTVTAPTCLDKGYTTYTCACGDTYEGDYVDALGHEFNDDGDCIHEGCDVKKDHACEFTSEVTKAPTCTETGVETFTCTCGESYTEEIAALGHTEETVEAVAPSCEATGLTEGKKCSVCGEITVAQTEVDATGHTTTNGVCGNCGKEITEAKPFDVTLSFADKTSRTEFSSTKQVWVQDNVTFTNNKASSSNAVADYAKPVRLYAKSNIVIDAGEYQITKIVFDCYNGTYATALKNSINVSGATVTVSSDKVTVTFTAAVDTFTIASLTAQVRLDSITFTCK